MGNLMHGAGAVRSLKEPDHRLAVLVEIDGSTTGLARLIELLHRLSGKAETVARHSGRVDHHVDELSLVSRRPGRRHDLLTVSPAHRHVLGKHRGIGIGSDPSGPLSCADNTGCTKDRLDGTGREDSLDGVLEAALKERIVLVRRQVLRQGVVEQRIVRLRGKVGQARSPRREADEVANRTSGGSLKCHLADFNRAASSGQQGSAATLACGSGNDRFLAKRGGGSGSCASQAECACGSADKLQSSTVGNCDL